MMELRLTGLGDPEPDGTHQHWQIEGTYDFQYWVILCTGESNWPIAENMVHLSNFDRICRT